MPRTFKANSTKLEPKYRPENVDVAKKNPDSNCVVSIPFNGNLVMSQFSPVASIDSLSLLASSYTFNNFCQVFDEFKIQQYHACIDLTQPATVNLRSNPMFSLDFDSPFCGDDQIGVYIDDDEDHYVKGVHTKNEVYAKMEEILYAAGIAVLNDGARSFNASDATGYGLYFRRMLYELVFSRDVCFNYDYINSLGGSIPANVIFTNVTFPDNIPHGFNGNLSTYQQVGACGLRQIPKHFFNYDAQCRDNDIRYQLGVPVTHKDMESVGNYIHQSYMPGSGLHLSLDMKGTSATEKSLYYPTSCMSNIALFDSINQQGRFCPICFVENVVNSDNLRNMLTSGVGTEGYVEIMKQSLIQISVNGTQNANVMTNMGCYLQFSVQYTVEEVNHTAVFKFPFTVYPLLNTINGYNVDSAYQCITFGSKNYNDADFSALDDNIDQYLYNTRLSDVWYALYTGTDLYSELQTCLSLQMYVVCRFRKVRNIASMMKVAYPYCIFNMNGNYEIVDGGNTSLVRVADRNMIPINVSNSYHQPAVYSVLQPFIKNSIGQIDRLVNFVGPDDVFARSYGDNNALLDHTEYVWGGIIVPVSGAPSFAYCVFNCFARANGADFIVRSILGLTGYNDSKYIVIMFIDHDKKVRVKNSNVPAADANNDAVNACWNVRNWSNLNIEISISRSRSVALVDQSYKNQIVEIPITWDALKHGGSRLDGNEMVGVGFVYSFGGIVGNPNPVTSALI